MLKKQKCSFNYNKCLKKSIYSHYYEKKAIYYYACTNCNKSVTDTFLINPGVSNNIKIIILEIINILEVTNKLTREQLISKIKNKDLSLKIDYALVILKKSNALESIKPMYHKNKSLKGKVLYNLLYPEIAEVFKPIKKNRTSFKNLSSQIINLLQQYKILSTVIIKKVLQASSINILIVIKKLIKEGILIKMKLKRQIIYVTDKNLDIEGYLLVNKKFYKKYITGINFNE